MLATFSSTGRTCVVVLMLMSAAVLSPAVAVAEEHEPTWKVFDDVADTTPQPVVEAMLKLGKVRSNDVVYDLGCGDGRIVVTAAKRYGARAFGVDINPKMIARAKANAEKNNVADKTDFIEGDLYKTDLNSATVITLFLWPTMNIKLRPRLLDLAPGTRIVSHDNDMGDWRPDSTKWVTHTKGGDRPLHLWIVPAKIDGTWQLSLDSRAIDVKIEQKYQQFYGTAVVDGRSRRIRSGRVTGAQVSFELAVAIGKLRRFIGQVTPAGDINGEEWQAKRKE